MLAVLSGYRLAAMKTNRAYRKINQSGLCFVILLGSLNAPINVNPVGGGGSAGKGRGFDALGYPRCRAFDRAKRPRGRDI